MKEAEIAHYLGIPPETVRLGLSLALMKLSALFSFLDLPPENKAHFKHSLAVRGAEHAFSERIIER